MGGEVVIYKSWSQGFGRTPPLQLRYEVGGRRGCYTGFKGTAAHLRAVREIDGEDVAPAHQHPRFMDRIVYDYAGWVERDEEAAVLAHR